MNIYSSNHSRYSLSTLHVNLSFPYNFKGVIASNDNNICICLLATERFSGPGTAPIPSARIYHAPSDHPRRTEGNQPEADLRINNGHLVKAHDYCCPLLLDAPLSIAISFCLVFISH